jgi:mannose-1-phosphate guanylyltransferase/mannose-6-phosphate isomerase
MTDKNYSASAMSKNESLTNPNYPITPIILCGGSGTRLWPLSRQSFPKQFVPLIGNKSLLQLTLERTD